MSADTRSKSGLRAAPLAFLEAFVRDGKTIGAVSPTSRRVAGRMAALGRVAGARTVAEFGPGMGAITHELLATMPADARLWGFEVYQPFVQHLSETVTDPRFTLVAESAEMVTGVDTGMDEPGFDAIISSIPFSLIGPDLTGQIVDAVGKSLRPGAPFIALQYHPTYLMPYLREHFEEVRRHPCLWNFPPVILFRARNPRMAR